MDVDEILGVTTYSSWWWIIALTLFVLIIAWFVALPILTKRRVHKLGGYTAPPKPLPYGAMDPVRVQYQERIQTLAQRRADEEITDRTLHLELSETLREYVKLRIGLPADTMTLTDLQAAGATESVISVIERCYHPAFSQAAESSPFGQEPVERAVTVREALNVVERF